MADYTKDREEQIGVVVDFTDALDTGDSVVSLDAVEMTKRQGSAWVDVSSEFGSPTGTLNGDKVNVTLGAASAGDQEAGVHYIVRVAVTTSNSETLIGTPTLKVTAEGDPDAP